MAYQHKKVPCSRTPKDILENILGLRDSDYGLTGSSKTINASSAVREAPDAGMFSNGMQDEPEELLSTEEEQTESRQAQNHETKDLQEYRPSTEVECDAQEIKVKFEKKGKHRNYAEFRFDYDRS